MVQKYRYVVFKIGENEGRFEASLVDLHDIIKQIMGFKTWAYE